MTLIAENFYLRNFEEVIRTAKATGEFPLEAKLILRGRIEYATERGEITANEAKRLLASIDDDFYLRTNNAAIIASLGEL